MSFGHRGCLNKSIRHIGEEASNQGGKTAFPRLAAVNDVSKSSNMSRSMNCRGMYRSLLADLCIRFSQQALLTSSLNLPVQGSLDASDGTRSCMDMINVREQDAITHQQHLPSTFELRGNDRHVMLQSPTLRPPYRGAARLTLRPPYLVSSAESGPAVKGRGSRLKTACLLKIKSISESL